MSNRIFLLGGQDLEMKTIREMLEAQGEEFIDKNLAWGAKLSDYATEIPALIAQGKTPIGIELTEDIPPPPQYIPIDHHNDRHAQPSAIEQIATLTGATLTHWHKLVAANDSAYIPGMQTIGATEEEIQRVRAADRAAQGITEADELLAVESIAQHTTQRNGITIIQSLPKLFTPIVDRMYGKTDRLLVWRPEKLNYYGKGAAQLAEHFHAWIEDHTAYHGGGPDGYFGIAHTPDPTELKHRMERVLQWLEHS